MSWSRGFNLSGGLYSGFLGHLIFGQTRRTINIWLLKEFTKSRYLLHSISTLDHSPSHMYMLSFLDALNIKYLRSRIPDDPCRLSPESPPHTQKLE